MYSRFTSSTPLVLLIVISFIFAQVIKAEDVVHFDLRFPLMQYTDEDGQKITVNQRCYSESPLIVGATLDLVLPQTVFSIDVGRQTYEPAAISLRAPNQVTVVDGPVCFNGDPFLKHSSGAPYAYWKLAGNGVPENSWLRDNRDAIWANSVEAHNWGVALATDPELILTIRTNTGTNPHGFVVSADLDAITRAAFSGNYLTVSETLILFDSPVPIGEIGGIVLEAVGETDVRLLQSVEPVVVRDFLQIEPPLNEDWGGNIAPPIPNANFGGFILDDDVILDLSTQEMLDSLQEGVDLYFYRDLTTP